MAELDWQCKIHRHRGSFIHKDELEEHCHVFRLLSGAEKFDDEAGRDGDPDPLGLINPLYDAEIEAIRRQWDNKETEKQKQDKHIKDLTEKVVKNASEEQWVAPFKRLQNFPRFSSFSKQQQRFVVAMLARYWATGVPANPHPSEARNVRRLVELLAAIRVEQEEYLKFAREVNTTQLSRYNHMNPQIDQYIQRCMENKIVHAKSTYPSEYQQLRMLPLAPEAGQPPGLTVASEQLELGEVPVCVIPDMKTPTNVKRHAYYLDQFFPSNDVYPKRRGKGFKPRDGSYLYKMPVSSDPNLSQLSSGQEFDVVTSPSALKTLLDNSAPWDRQWEVPVTVRLLSGPQAGTHRKVVFLDKPLPPRSLTFVERNVRAHKRTARLLVCKRVTGPGPIDYSVWSSQPDRRKTRDFKEKIAHKKKKNKQQKRQQAQEEAERGRQQAGSAEMDTAAPPEDADLTSEDSDSDSDTALQIDCAEQQQPEEEEQREESGESAEEGGRTEDLVGGDGTESPTRQEPGGPADSATDGTRSPTRQELGGPADGAADGTRSPTRQEPGGPADSAADGTRSPTRREPGGPADSAADGTRSPTRRELGAAEGTQPASPETVPRGGSETAGPAAAAAGQEGEGSPEREGAGFLRPPPGLNVQYRLWRLGELRLLLRSATHGMRENPNAGLVRYTVHAKPAYQPSLGIEVMTRSEVLRQWLDCLLRPDSRVVRVHLDPVSQQVIAPEERTLSQLTEEFVKYDTGFRPQYGLQVLESVLRELTSLAPGQYLLSHDSRAGAFVRLSCSSGSSAPSGSSLNLNFPERPRRVALESPRCLAIDPSILTPFNTCQGRVPATFAYREMGDGGWKEYWSNLNKSGIKRKKKKKKKSQAKRQQTDGPAAPKAAAPVSP